MWVWVCPYFHKCKSFNKYFPAYCGLGITWCCWKIASEQATFAAKSRGISVQILSYAPSVCCARFFYQLFLLTRVVMFAQNPSLFCPQRRVCQRSLQARSVKAVPKIVNNRSCEQELIQAHLLVLWAGAYPSSSASYPSSSAVRVDSTSPHRSWNTSSSACASLYTWCPVGLYVMAFLKVKCTSSATSCRSCVGWEYLLCATKDKKNPKHHLRWRIHSSLQSPRDRAKVHGMLDDEKIICQDARRRVISMDVSI